MRLRPFGPDGPMVSAVGQGTWGMERNPSAAEAALRRGLDLGMSHVDTAEMYGNGRVEEIVGSAIRGRRDEVFLVSKILPENADRRGTRRACEASLARLGTDHLDCYLLHWVGRHPIAETVEAFEKLVEGGLIRSWGVSNFDEVKLGEAVDAAGPGQVACDQVLYHLLERSVEHRVQPACSRLGVTLVGYSPFGSGRFPEPGSPGRQTLDDIAASRAVSVRQVALAFLLREPDVLVIPKAADPSHVADNAAAAELELTAEEIERLDGAFPRGAPRPGLPMI